MKMLSAYYVCCIYLIALQNNFIMDANTINPDQTATKSGFILLAKLATNKQMRLHKQMREQTAFVVNGGKRVENSGL